MSNKHRYFVLGGKILYLPPCAANSGNCWVHTEHGIEREHLKPNGTDGLQEVTEDQARAIDPEMFTECIDRPYGDYITPLDKTTLKEFYEYKYERQGGI